jgi:uncharacterized membrane protein
LTYVFTSYETFKIFNILNNFNYVSGAVPKNDDGSEIYLVGIIILAILLIILVFILTYFICQNRRLKSKANLENKTQSRNISDDTYHYADKDDGSYQDVKNEQPTSTALERPGDEENADHIYSQLNEVQNDYVQEEETGM